MNIETQRAIEKALQIAADDRLMEVARKAVEDDLINMRDSRVSEPFRRNGLVVFEKDGSPSSIIRFGVEAAMRIGLRAIAKHLGPE